MTAPQLIQRTLTFTFASSVNATTSLPDILQISVIPLQDATNVSAGATYAGGLKSQEIELSNPSNVVVFDLLPSNAPGNDFTVNYRVMWRAGVMGRTFTYDFAMPDADITWEVLIAGVGNIIDGSTYLQQSDLGVPNRVARLNSQGLVVDSQGTPVATASDVTTVRNLLTAESNARLAGDSAVRATLESELASQITATTNTAKNYSDSQIATVSGDINAERSARIASDNSLQAQVTANLTALTTEASTRTSQVGTINSTLAIKADLDNTGHVPVAQIPDTILTNATAVPNQASMLGLSYPTVHKGDLAVRPDGVWLLTTDDPSQLSNWVSLTTVSSVNGMRGAITLAAADVGAIPAGGAVTIGQVTGLSTALSSKANQLDLAAAQASLAAIQTDSTLVHTVAGVVPTPLMSSDMVYLNSVGQLVKKNGDIIPLGSGGSGAVFSVNSKTGLVVLTAADVGAMATGASIPQTQVTGLSTSLGLKADASTVATLNTAMASKADLSSGVVPLSQVPTLPQTKVTGLDGTVTGNQLTTTSNAINRIATLEGQIVGLGGGGGSGVSPQVPFYTASNTTTPVVLSDFTAQVHLHSPWGIDSDGTLTGTVGTWYFLYTGVRSTDVAYPYITANGHLNLRKWDETGASDPVYALSSTVSTLSTTVGTKANQGDLIATNAAVALKANQTDLTTLSTTVDTKANTADLNSLATTVSTKAAASDLAITNSTVSTKANSSDLATLTTTVGTKANSSDLATTNSNVTAVNTALTTKADLVTGTVPLTQLPAYPQSKVTGLTTSLSTKADLVSGTVPLNQLPNIPQTQVSGLGTTLGNKADLVGGVVPMSQIPLGALPNVVTVANRTALLALTTAQVQYGDLALILPGNADSGTYVMTGADPSQWANWTALSTATAPVNSVNGYTGTVVLTATDVGALSASANVAAWTAATGSPLAGQLGTFATTTSLTSGLSTKTTASDVQSMLYTSSWVKRADYVATSPVASLSGLQTVDGVLVPSNALVLLTAQSSSINNGLWVASTGTWVRPPSYATGRYVAKDMVVVVSNQTASNPGTNNALTTWQCTAVGGSSGGFIDTDATSWLRIGWDSPPFSPVGNNGVNVTGSTFSAVAPSTLTVGGGNTVPGGIQITSAGISADPVSIPRKATITVPATNPATITHNLATTTPSVTLWDVSGGIPVLVLAGVTSPTANTISIEFASTPSSGQYKVCVVG